MPSPLPNPQRLRVAAISFLNPAPLLWSFEHDPAATELRSRYDVRYTLPSQCAAQLHTGEADLGLIPIAAMATMPEVAAVPGCVIASLHSVQSIQLVLRPGVTLQNVRTLAADAASRSSVAYVQTLLRHFYNNDPHVHEHRADLSTMLADAEAALLIGDPALMALQQRETAGAFAACTWIDVAVLWRERTGLPWVAALWAVRPEALPRCGFTTQQLIADLTASRDAGLANRETIVHEWAAQLPLLPERLIRDYLRDNIHYVLDEDCLRAIDCFYNLAATTGVLPHYRLKLL